MTEALQALLDYALDLPSAQAGRPWGEYAAKVAGKNFVFLARVNDGAGLQITVKLPENAEAVLAVHEFARPAGYNLARAGWVTAEFAGGEAVPVELLKSWIDESYAAVRPKR